MASMKLSKDKRERIEGIFDKVLMDIKPKQGIKKKVLKVKSKIDKQISKLKVYCDCFIGGSIGKDTFLKGDFDCDLFLRFSKDYSEKEINTWAKKILKPFAPQILKGSREYFFFVEDKIDFEVIPVYKIKRTDKAENSIDYSPLHVEWVESHSKYRNEIRLAKRFCKSHKVYGAESYRNGFSGHAIEILVIYYKGFLNLLKSAVEWDDFMVIDVENRYKGVNPALMLDESKLGPLVLVDPVTPDRNAAAALSREKYEIFIKACRDFIDNPSEDAFRIEYLSPELIKSRCHTKGNITFIFKHIAADKGSPDKIGTRMYKEYQRLLNRIKKSDFSFVKSDWDWDGGQFAWSYIQLKDEVLPPEKVLKGPPSNLEKHSEQFRQAHNDIFEKKGRLFAREKREFRRPIEFINYLMKKVLKYQKETLLFKILR
jgi:tRNA nucleotidyltransferase (CCA-adding enzyme)